MIDRSSPIGAGLSSVFHWIMALSAVLCLAPVRPAGAQVDGSSVEVSVSLGHAFFEKWLRIEDGLYPGLRVGYNPEAKWGVDLGIDSVSSTDPQSSEINSSTFRFVSLGYVANLIPVHAFSPYLSCQLGWAQLSAAGENSDSLGLGLVAGAKYRFGKRFGLRAEIKDVIARFRDSNTQTWLVSVGATVSFGRQADDDGDGVGNGADRCPETPRGAVVNADGCPTDSDGDGVPEGLDRCSETPPGVPVDEHGCPRPS